MLHPEVRQLTDYVKMKPKYPDSPAYQLEMNVAFIVTDTLSWVAHFIISSSGRAGDRSPLLSHGQSPYLWQHFLLWKRVISCILFKFISWIWVVYHVSEYIISCSVFSICSFFFMDTILFFKVWVRNQYVGWSVYQKRK